MYCLFNKSVATIKVLFSLNIITSAPMALNMMKYAQSALCANSNFY